MPKINQKATSATKTEHSQQIEKPLNLYGRQHMPDKAGHVVLMEMEDEDTLTQFQINPDRNHPFYRPIQLAVMPPQEAQEERSALQNITNAGMSKSVAGFNKESTISEDTIMQDANLVSPQKPLHKSSLLSPSRLPKVGHTPNGSKVTSKRHMLLSITDLETKKVTEGAVLFFSPEKRNNKYNNKYTGSKRKEISQDPTYALMAGRVTENTPPTTKGGERIMVAANNRNRKQAPAQKTIMKRSAKEALLQTIVNGKDKYEAHVLATLIKLAENASMEWLHCLAFSLAPKHFEPQHHSNLGAAPNYINSYMMVLEKLALYFVKLYPRAVSVMPLFRMLQDSQMIDEIEYEVHIEHAGKILSFSNKVKAIALLDASNWPSCSDTEQLKWVAEALLNNNATSAKKAKF